METRRFRVLKLRANFRNACWKMLMKRIHIIVVKVLQDDRQFHQGTSAHFKNPTVLKSPETSISVHDCFNVKDFYFLDHLRFHGGGVSVYNHANRHARYRCKRPWPRIMPDSSNHCHGRDVSDCRLWLANLWPIKETAHRERKRLRKGEGNDSL